MSIRATGKIIDMVPRPRGPIRVQASFALVFYYALRVTAYALILWVVEQGLGTDLITIAAWAIVVGVAALAGVGVIGTFRTFLED